VGSEWVVAQAGGKSVRVQLVAVQVAGWCAVVVGAELDGRAAEGVEAV